MVDLDSWAGGYRLPGAVIGSVFRMLGVMLGCQAQMYFGDMHVLI